MTSSLESIVGSLGHEGVAPAEKLGDYSVDGFTPNAAVFPPDVKAISEVLSQAAREGKVVTPWGGGTQMSLGNRPRGVDLVVGTSRLNRMLFHESADLVASVEAGITLKSLQDQLGKKRQFLPLEAPFPSRATIGGILAANASGPSSLVYGTARDWLIGIKVAHSYGAVTKSGGKVVKNVTGYDLNKLYTGSLGTLGVIVEATFKVTPLPLHKSTLVATYPSLSSAMASAQELLRQSFSYHALQVVNREVMGRLAGLDGLRDADAAVVALVAGRATSVKRKLDDSAKVIERGNAVRVEMLSTEQGDGLWQAVTDLGWAGKGLPDLAVRVNTLPSQVRDVLESASSLGGPPFTQGLVGDPGSGLVRLFWWAQEDASDTMGKVENMIRSLRKMTRRHTGHVLVERCPTEVKGNIDVWGESPESIAAMRRIKSELDPAGILNPGRFVGGI